MYTIVADRECVPILTPFGPYSVAATLYLKTDPLLPSGAPGRLNIIAMSLEISLFDR